LRLVAGLGNPGEDYRRTRHNLGFRVVDRLAELLDAGGEERECGALVRRAGTLLLAKPQTYMNRSGWALRCLADRNAVAPEAVLVIYDEVALPLGRLRIRRGGSPGGHRGMESIVESLRTDAVPRLRIGIGPADEGGIGSELADYVLAPFAPAEEEAVAAAVARAAEAALVWRSGGVEEAMNRFNAAG